MIGSCFGKITATALRIDWGIQVWRWGPPSKRLLKQSMRWQWPDQGNDISMGETVKFAIRKWKMQSKDPPLFTKYRAESLGVPCRTIAVMENYSGKKKRGGGGGAEQHHSHIWQRNKPCHQSELHRDWSEVAVYLPILQSVRGPNNRLSL